MKHHWRLLMASTVLSGLTGLGAAQATTNVGLSKPDEASRAPIVLAQAEDNNNRNKQQQQQQRRDDKQQRQQQQNNRNPSPPPPPPAANRASPPPPPAATRSNNPSSNNQNNNRNQNSGNDNRNNNQNSGNTNNRNNNQDRGNVNNRNNNQNGGNNRNNANTNVSPAAKPASPPPPPVANTPPGRNNPNGNVNPNREANPNNANPNNNHINGRNQPATANPSNVNTPARGGAATDPNVTRTRENTSPNDKTKPIRSEGAGKGVAVQSSNGQPIRKVDQLKSERKETKEGNRTVIKEVDRTIIREGNRTIIRHDEGDRFRLGARDVRVERHGNENRTIIVRPGGERIVTVVDRNGGLLRRSRILPNGREIVIINNRPRVGTFFVVLPPPRILIPRDRYIVAYRSAPPALVYQTLMAPPVDVIERPYTLDEIRYSAPVRDRMPRIDIDSITFDTGSWDLAPEQIDKLAAIADGMKRVIEQNPQTVFLVEGYTDAVGNEDDNLSLSDRRAESVAVALTEQFQVPPENLSTQGYGEQDLKIPSDGPEEANRRVTVRNITPLLDGKVAQGGPAPGGDQAPPPGEQAPPPNEPAPQ
jgi:outer membrane protein OmpA-like peptidoglycan-associated protein